MNRRSFMATLGAAATPARAASPGFKLVDVTRQAGIQFVHNSGAFGRKYLPETLGSGCAFLDYDSDGWQDILLVNGMDWPERQQRRTTLSLYRNHRDGTFRDVTKQAGLDVAMYGLGVAVGDFNNDGFPDIFISCAGQSRLFQNTGRGTFVDVTEKSGLAGRQGFSTSAMWVDYDRDGLLDLFVCNYVRWSQDQDISCSMDGKQKSYCTPEAYRGATSWLFRNLGNGKFKDVTAECGIFDTSSKSLGVALLDFDNDGWPDIFVANDTQPNKLYQNLRNGKFQEVGVRAGVAFSEDGKARAGMGVDVADLDNTGIPTLAVTNFHNEMLALYKGRSGGLFHDLAPGSEIGRVTRGSLGFGCFFFDANLDGWQDLLVVNGHIDNTMRNTQYAQPPHLFLNTGGAFRDAAAEVGSGFVAPKVGRGAAFGDFDNDGDQDVLVTTNHGPAYLYRNDQSSGNQSVRFRLVGTESNRDGIGSSVRIYYGDRSTTKTVKSGGSYLSQSELPVTFGLGKRDMAERVVVRWSRGRTEEFRNVRAGRYQIVEGKGISPEKS
ncbi:MAG TPA: CRTAC1 family protein [Bryobacteraceae bacterium]|nr:CRTAC1 family protein [Bryobacteraceae bacterium]